MSGSVTRGREDEKQGEIKKKTTAKCSAIEFCWCSRWKLASDDCLQLIGLFFQTTEHFIDVICASF